VHPNNPTGSFVKPPEAAELAAICAEREMAIIADEVFLDYPAAGSQAPASFAFNREVLTFTLSGLSKISALPQMKLAWLGVSGPESFAHDAIDRLEVIADTYLSPNTPVQLAAPTFLALGPAMRAQLLERIAANLACLDAALAAPGLRVISRLQREGGWYAILRVPIGRADSSSAAEHPGESPDESLCVELVRRSSVLIHPGSFYNFPSPGYLVLSLITPRADFEEGIRRLFHFFAG
jgi:alanine-synthesizing transaminase